MFSIQRLEPKDHPEVRELSRSLGRHSAPAFFDAGACLLATKDANGALIGWAKAQWWEPQDPIAPDGYYLGGIEVHAAWQGRGVATALGLARLRWIAQRAKTAWCVVNARNAASLALQRSLGFTLMVRASGFGTVEFTGAEGVLLRRNVEDLAPGSGMENDE